MIRGGRLDKDFLLLIGPVLFMALAFGFPIALVVSRSIGSGGGTAGFLHSPYYRGIFAFSAGQAALSTFFSLLAGMPGAYFVGRCRFPGRRLLRSLSTVPFVLPPILAVLGFVLVFGNAGLVNAVRRLFLGEDIHPWRILYSLKAIVMAHVFYNFPLTVRIVGDAWAALPLAERKAAASLGADRLRTFLAADFPRLLPGIATAGIVTFLYCFMSFSIVLVLGGGPQLSTIEVEIYRLIKHQLDFARGSALAAVESLFAFLLLFLYAIVDSRLRARLGDDTRNPASRPLEKLTGTRRLAAIAYLAPASLFIVCPLVLVVVHSFFTKATRVSPAAFSFIHWKRLFAIGEAVPLKALLRTVILASGVSIFSTFTASALGWYSVRHPRWRKFAETIMALPLGVSSIILGLGWLLFLQRIPRNDLPRLIALGAAHSLISLPFCFRLVIGRLKQISIRVPQAARAAGANAVQSFIHVELPMARRALISSGVFAFALSAGELNSTMILAPGDFTTVPLAIYRLIAAYDFNGACALGTVLIVICLAAFFLLDQAEGL